jgi:hypothetical protein
VRNVCNRHVVIITIINAVVVAVAVVVVVVESVLRRACVPIAQRTSCVFASPLS